MPETQVVKAANGIVAPPPAAKEPTLAELQAQLAALAGRLADVTAENEQLRRPHLNTGALYSTVPPSGKYLTPAGKIVFPSGGMIMGPRKKFVELIDEVTSGRVQAFLDAHPEVK